MARRIETNGNEQFYRKEFFDGIDKKFDAIDERFDNIEQNHLAHIYAKLGDIEKNLARYTGGIAVILAIVEILLRFAGK